MACRGRLAKAIVLGDVLPGEGDGAAVLGGRWSEEGWGGTYPFAMLSGLAGSACEVYMYSNTGLPKVVWGVCASAVAG